MVPAPVCAELWEPVGHIRQRLLANSFSFLPIVPLNGSDWRLVADVDVAKFLREAADHRDRRRRMRESLEMATAVDGGITLRPARTATSGTGVLEMARNLGTEPVLILNREGQRLLGIVTAFDLL
jgi:CBS-domain-containing membrane protein